jgi:hypothetical protein
VNTAARRDPSLIHRFTEEWKEDAKVEQRADKVGLSQMLLTAAISSAESGNEAQAKTFFIESAFHRVLQGHLYFLIRLREKSPFAADQLFSETMRILSRRQIYEANEALIMASYLFSESSGVVYSLVGNYNAANVSGNLSSRPKNEVLAREYLSFLFRNLNASEAIPPSVVYFGLKGLLPQYQALLPDLVPQVQQKLSSLLADVPKEQVISYERRFTHKEDSSEEDSWEARIRAAEKSTKADLRDLEYFTAITGYFLPKEDFTNAYRLADKLSDLNLKQKATDYINFKFAQRKIEKGEAEVDQISILRKISDPVLKSVLLIEIGEAAIGRKDPYLASEMLNWAAEESARIQGEQEKIGLKLAIAQIYLAIELQRAFQEAKDAIKLINRAKEFNIAGSNLGFKVIVYGLANNLPVWSNKYNLLTFMDKLSQLDFVGASLLCESIDNKVTRLWAMLAAIGRPLREFSSASRAQRKS